MHILKTYHDAIDGQSNQYGKPYGCDIVRKSRVERISEGKVYAHKQRVKPIISSKICRREAIELKVLPLGSECDKAYDTNRSKRTDERGSYE